MAVSSVGGGNDVIRPEPSADSGCYCLLPDVLVRDTGDLIGVHQFHDALLEPAYGPDRPVELRHLLGHRLTSVNFWRVTVATISTAFLWSAPQAADLHPGVTRP